MKRPIPIFLLICILALAGCQTVPSQREALIESPELIVEFKKKLPFDQAWIQEGTDFSRYDEIMIARVNTSILSQMNWGGQNLPVTMKQDANMLALYAENAFIHAFMRDSKKHFRFVQSGGPKTLIFEVALTDIQPSGKTMTAVVDGPSKMQTEIGTVTMECRFRNGATGDVIATFSDVGKEEHRSGVRTSLSWHSHAEAIINEWAEQFVQVLNEETAGFTTDPSPIELKAW